MPEDDGRTKSKKSGGSGSGWCSERAYVTLMLFFGMANAYVMRTNMSVAIVAMVNHTAITQKENDNQTAGTGSHHSQDGPYVWSYQMQGIILASFFYGYVLTQIPFGFLIKNYGACRFLGWGMMINSVVAFIVPTAAEYGGPYGLSAVRFIQGLGEGPIVPCTHALLAQWIPPNERSRCSAAVYSGAQFGTVISMPISGVLAEYGLFMWTGTAAWHSIFYVFGTFSTIWCIFFLWTVFDSPEKNKKMKEAERIYITNSVWATNESKNEKIKTPFKQIATSLPFWAILFAHMGQNYGYETLMTELPTYLANVLKVRLKENGLYSALPYVGMWLCALLLSLLADCMISRSKISITVTRKVLNSIGQYGPGIALILVAFTTPTLALTLSLLTLGLSLNGAVFSGFKVNHLDLSPIFAGLLVSITNCTANFVGLLAPIIAGVIINKDPSIENWRIVFLIAAGVYIFCASFFNLFASGERQW